MCVRVCVSVKVTASPYSIILEFLASSLCVCLRMYLYMCVHVCVFPLVYVLRVMECSINSLSLAIIGMCSKEVVLEQ